jgi:hypothetical protein
VMSRLSHWLKNGTLFDMAFIYCSLAPYRSKVRARRCSWRDSACAISMSMRSDCDNPLASQSLGYMLNEVNPGRVFTSFTNIASPLTKNSTLAIPSQPSDGDCITVRI